MTLNNFDLMQINTKFKKFESEMLIDDSVASKPYCIKW